MDIYALSRFLKTRRDGTPASKFVVMYMGAFHTDNIRSLVQSMYDVCAHADDRDGQHCMKLKPKPFAPSHPAFWADYRETLAAILKAPFDLPDRPLAWNDSQPAILIQAAANLHDTLGSLLAFGDLLREATSGMNTLSERAKALVHHRSLNEADIQVLKAALASAAKEARAMLARGVPPGWEERIVGRIEKATSSLGFTNPLPPSLSSPEWLKGWMQGVEVRLTEFWANVGLYKGEEDAADAYADAGADVMVDATTGASPDVSEPSSPFGLPESYKFSPGFIDNSRRARHARARKAFDETTGRRGPRRDVKKSNILDAKEVVRTRNAIRLKQAKARAEMKQREKRVRGNATPPPPPFPN